MSAERQHVTSRPALAGGAGNGLERDLKEWEALPLRLIRPGRPGHELMEAPGISASRIAAARALVHD